MKNNKTIHLGFNSNSSGKTIRNLTLIVFVIFTISSIVECKDAKEVQIRLVPNSSELITEQIQEAIDSCAGSGGGVVIFPAGIYLSGGIQMKSNVTLQFEKGAILQGSNKYSDYENDAFIYGNNLSDISIQGEGVIDGVDCYNPKGEEGFRGPHCIRLIGCKNITFRDITIKNSANWAINCRHCSNGMVDHVFIRGGHDGLHTRFCDHFKVFNCDFRTGDDAFAGNDNRDFVVTDCKINTSCNGFRIGCYNFTVKNCKLWGPGEYIHKSQKRNNMLAAFVHFSPKDENPKLPSGNWNIQDVVVSQVDNFYVYNFENGLWQTGQPVTSVHFKDINAAGLLKAFVIVGDKDRELELSVRNSIFSYREGTKIKEDTFEGIKSKSNAFASFRNFGCIDLDGVTFWKSTKKTLLDCEFGNEMVLHDVHCGPDSTSISCIFKKIDTITR